MDELEFAQRLKRYRRERGLTQQELADRIGVSNKSVSRWESGSLPGCPYPALSGPGTGCDGGCPAGPRCPCPHIAEKRLAESALLCLRHRWRTGLLFTAEVRPRAGVLGPLSGLSGLRHLSPGLTTPITPAGSAWALGHVLCVSWTLAEELGGVVFQVLFPTVLSQWKNMIFQLLRGDAGALLQLVLVLGPLWLAGACGLTVLTQLAARRLAGERGDLPVRLPDLRGHPRLARAPFAWSKAMPALCPIVLAGFWYLYRQTLLPRFWYQHQQELYLAVWTMARGAGSAPLPEAEALGDAAPGPGHDAGLPGVPGMLAYPQVYSLFSGRLMEEKAEMSTQYYLRFGQPSEELAVAALLVAAVYLLCCFLRVEWVPAEQKGRQEPGGVLNFS